MLVRCEQHLQSRYVGLWWSAGATGGVSSRRAALPVGGGRWLAHPQLQAIGIQERGPALRQHRGHGALGAR